MKIIDVITSRLFLIFPEILNFWKIYNPSDWQSVDDHRQQVWSVDSTIQMMGAVVCYEADDVISGC